MHCCTFVPCTFTPAMPVHGCTANAAAAAAAGGNTLSSRTLPAGFIVQKVTALPEAASKDTNRPNWEKHNSLPEPWWDVAASHGNPGACQGQKEQHCSFIISKAGHSRLKSNSPEATLRLSQTTALEGAHVVTAQHVVPQPCTRNGHSRMHENNCYC